MLFGLRPQDMSDNTRDLAAWIGTPLIVAVIAAGLWFGLRAASCHDAVADGCLWDQRGPILIIPGPVGHPAQP
ncbi:hypothetical protein [Nitrospirillum amazonense]|uniref:hypothetical protein n=1 Tax=Nitrospirillum amazonense TaxID=28077 RepID=UPI0024129AF3|nr:hypothetical protein [Nitrospirillum amazonense]MDG3444520.1 hypothetical protein [Nitrospirillum amazonense]